MKNNVQLFIWAISFIILMFHGVESNAQCFIKSTDQSQGYVTHYLDPELVAQTDKMGVALSVQSVGEKYYLTLTYQFIDRAQPMEEKVGLALTSGYTLELSMYTMEVGSANGVELCMAVYFLEDEHYPYFRSSDLKTIHVRTQDNVKYDLPVSTNSDALKRQLKCFGK